MRRLPLFSAGLVCLLVAATAPLRALEVRQALWGFDGRVAPGRISPLSVLLANPGNQPFEGELVLEQDSGPGSHSGAPYAMPVFLSPQSERWVQFHAFVGQGEEFTLSWGRGPDSRHKFDHVATAPPARVLLTDPSNPFGVGGAFKTFPDHLFPTTVAATDSLDAVVLDYTPRWEAARRDAFLDWLKRGGILMVLPGANGDFPAFTGPLEVLNITGESAPVGAGTVLRQRTTRRQVSKLLFAERGFPERELKQGSKVVVYDFERTVFERLARMTRPNIRWWLINSLTVLYVLVVGPLHYRFSQRVDYRLSIASLVGGVLLFGSAFAFIGRRGYGEDQAAHSLAIARSLGDGRWDVTQWASAFATRGDLYALTHRAPANLYAAVSMDAVNGKIFNGKDGVFLADIPLFSSRQFMHRAVLTGDDTRVTVESWALDEAQTKLTTLALRVTASFPKEVFEFCVRYEDDFYLLKRDGDLLVLKEDGPKAFEKFVTPSLMQDPGPNTGEPDLQSSLQLLFARALDGRDYFQQQITMPPQSADRLQLYVFAKSPESFRLQTPGFNKQHGCVLYVQEVYKP